MISRRQLMAAGLMLAGAGGAVALTPDRLQSQERGEVDLELLIPEEFAGWTIDEGLAPVLPDPSAQTLSDEIYTQVLTRTYAHAKGEKVTLVLAYGADQRDDLQVHRPEICYAAQGFDVIDLRVTPFDPGNNNLPTLPVTRVMTQAGFRLEPVSYWIRLGTRIVPRNRDRQIYKIMAGLGGLIPDGLLVRFSNVGTQAASGYAIHDRFANDLLTAVDEDTRAFLIGTDFVDV